MAAPAIERRRGSPARWLRLPRRRRPSRTVRRSGGPARSLRLSMRRRPRDSAEARRARRGFLGAGDRAQARRPDSAEARRARCGFLGAGDRAPARRPDSAEARYARCGFLGAGDRLGPCAGVVARRDCCGFLCVGDREPQTGGPVRSPRLSRGSLLAPATDRRREGGGGPASAEARRTRCGFLGAGAGAEARRALCGFLVAGYPEPLEARRTRCSCLGEPRNGRAWLLRAREATLYHCAASRGTLHRAAARRAAVSCIPAISLILTLLLARAKCTSNSPAATGASLTYSHPKCIFSRTLVLKVSSNS